MCQFRIRVFRTVFVFFFMINGVYAATETDSKPLVEWHFAGEGHSNSLYLTDECILLNRITRKELSSQLVLVDDSVDLSQSQVIGSIVRDANARFKELCDLKSVGETSDMRVWISNSVGRNSNSSKRGVSLVNFD